MYFDLSMNKMSVGRASGPTGVGACPNRPGWRGPMADPERRKPGRPKRAGPARETVVALKGSTEWKAWLDGFAGHCRLGLADTIEQSLDFYAQQRSYGRPPKR
jgi:hypothetical protein